MFVNATMLAGIAGAVLPLVLHLLGRARSRNVQWGAMMFLTDDDAGRLRSARVRELILLLLRMGTVALLAVALARPILAPAAGGAGSSCTVIIIDRSASMAYEENGRPRIEPARRAALSVLASLRRGDEAAVILAPDSQPPQLTTDLNALATRVSELRPTSARADLSGALGAASRLLGSSLAADRSLFVICDRQSSNWSEIDEIFASNWRHSVRDHDGRTPRFTVIPVGSDDAGNVAIESVRVFNPPVLRDVGTEIEVRLTNYGSQPRTGLPLTLSGGGRELYRTIVNLEPRQSHVARCALTLGTPGSMVLTARVTAEDLGSDDAMDCAVEVADPIGVLAVSGDERGDAASSQFRSEADFVRLALAPHTTAGEPGPDPARVQVISSEDWPELDRSRQQVVMLLNVPSLSQRQVRQIEQYVYGGGGLLIAPGNLSRVEDYNQQLWRDGAGVLPAELDSPVALDGSQATSLLGLELTHPLFRFLQGREDPVPTVPIGRYFRTRSTEPAGRVLGRYASGQPFVIEGSYGRGRVLLFTTSLDADWNSLPLSNCYLPMLQSAVRYLASGRLTERNVSLGETIHAVIQDATDARAVIDGPGSVNATVGMSRAGEGYELRFAGATRTGIYRVRVNTAAGQRLIHFVVLPARDESNLAGLDLQRWQALGRLLGFARMDDPEPAAIASRVGESRRRRELWPVLILCVFALSLGEMALARAWSATDGGGP